MSQPGSSSGDAADLPLGATVRLAPMRRRYVSVHPCPDRVEARPATICDAPQVSREASPHEGRVRVYPRRVSSEAPDSQRPSFVAVAVLTWRGYSATNDCLESLRRSTSWPLPVAVIDNGSGTGEGLRLAEEFGGPVTAVTLPANLGVPGGYNRGLQWAREVGASHVLLLNNDTICSDPRMIERLVAATAPDVAVVGPLVERPDGRLQTAGGVLRWRTARARPLRRNQIPRMGGPYEVDWVDGSCMLISLRAARHVGGLAAEYFMYWEEVDWCVRARRAGYRCLVEPRASITHIGSMSVTPQRQLRQWMRNKLLFMRRNAGRRDNATALLTLILLTVPSQIARQGLRPRRWIRVVSAAAAALTWNLADAYRRRSWLIGDR